MHPFSYDPFQQEAILNIRQGTSVFLSAPTGSGKTVLAEVAMEESLRLKGMAIYTAPIKALSNQKFRDFYLHYSQKIGILTGDVTLNPQAPLLIMTTEIYRNSLYEEKGRFAQCRWVIFDEVHYLDDPERGTVWEEALLLTPSQTNILALSATIPNARQLAAWIEKIHGRPVKVIEENHRPVPLQFHFQCQNDLYKNPGLLKAHGYRGSDRLGRRPIRRCPFRSRRHRGGGRFYFRSGSTDRGVATDFFHGRPNRADWLIQQIKEAGHLPCLYFTFSRKRTEELAWEFAGLGLASSEAKLELASRFDQLCKRLGIAHERSVWGMRELILQGVAFHHAGLLPTLKEVVEILFASRLIQVIVTTETFALGVNMPARSVVLDTLLKRSNGPRTVMRVRELAQMAGRAGRRGMDEEGFVYLRVNPWEVSFSDVTRLVQGKPETVSSRFSLTYATLLHLYQTQGSHLLAFYQKTLHAFQAPKAAQREAFNLIQQKLGLLEKLGYVEPYGKLTMKGEFATGLYVYELFLSELFEVGLLDSLEMTDLAILLTALVYEPRRGAIPFHLPRRIRSWSDPVNEILEKIHRQERHHRVSPMTKSPAFHLSAAIESWVSGARFDKVVQAVRVDEGELIRYFRMTVQLLRALVAAPAAGKGLKEKANHLIGRINRDEVDAEAELRRFL